MAFNPSNYVIDTAKPLPVILLLDVSTSMAGARIAKLNQAVKEMIISFSDNETSEVEIQVAIITFGAQVNLHLPYTSASDIDWEPVVTNGLTPMGTALTMAKDMIEDKSVTPLRVYKPTVILVSDGMPTDDWEDALHNFISSGRSSKCDRMAVSIEQQSAVVLDRFIEGCEFGVFFAENADQIRECFKTITNSVSIRSQSQNPNLVPAASDSLSENLSSASVTKIIPVIDELVEVETNSSITNEKPKFSPAESDDDEDDMF